MTSLPTDEEPNRWTRTRAILDTWSAVIIVGLLLVALGGAVLAYQTYENPAVEVDEEVVAAWSEETTLTHQAQVLRSNRVFERGQSLTNRETYFSRIAPELSGVSGYSYTASGDGTLDVESTATLRIRSLDSDGGVYWTSTEPLGGNATTGLAPGEQATVPVEINVSMVAQEIEDIEASLGTSLGTREVSIVFDTRVTGTVNGDPVANAHRDELVIEPDGAVYRVASDGGSQVTHETTATVSTPVEYGPLRAYGPFGLVVGSVGTAVALGVGRHRGLLAPPPAQLTALRRRRQREQFDEWISTGRVPDAALAVDGIVVDSLEDLVDVAIDTNQRVVEDTDREAFYVLDADWYWTYAFDDKAPLQTETLRLDVFDPIDDGDSNDEDTVDPMSTNGDTTAE